VNRDGKGFHEDRHSFVQLVWKGEEVVLVDDHGLAPPTGEVPVVSDAQPWSQWLAVHGQPTFLSGVPAGGGKALLTSITDLSRAVSASLARYGGFHRHPLSRLHPRHSRPYFSHPGHNFMAQDCRE
jgi:hypothetical protein